MSKKQGVQISYISGPGHWPDGPGILGGATGTWGDDADLSDEEYAQQLLDSIVAADQLSFYALNVAKSQLIDLSNQYNSGSIPTGWSIGTYNEAQTTISQINGELSKLGSRQVGIMNDEDIEVTTGLNAQFSEFVGVGIIPVIVIVVALIVAGIVAYELIQWLEDLTIDSDATVEQSAILQKAAMNLTPDEQKAYWQDIQNQVDKAYKGGYAAGNDTSLLGDASNLLMWGVIAFVAFKGIGMLEKHQTVKPAVSRIGKYRKSKKHNRKRRSKRAA